MQVMWCYNEMKGCHYEKYKKKKGYKIKDGEIGEEVNDIEQPDK